MADEQQPAPQGEAEKRTIQPVKYYLKDVSFETPNSPAVFLKEWIPNLELDIGNSNALTNDGHHEVTLTLTVTVKTGGETAYLAEVHQAGLFAITGFDDERLERLYSIYCNRSLYPYACSALSDLVSKGGFPQLLLSPINWLQIYEQRIAKEEPETPVTEES